MARVVVFLAENAFLFHYNSMNFLQLSFSPFVCLPIGVWRVALCN